MRGSARLQSMVGWSPFVPHRRHHEHEARFGPVGKYVVRGFLGLCFSARYLSQPFFQ